MTTPVQLAEALQHAANSYTSGTPGITPDPMLGRRLTVLAKRIRDRVHSNDPRMTAFDPFTDPAGYPWLPETAHAYLTDETNALWSFERWFTGLAQATAKGEEPTAEQFAELAEDVAQIQKLQDAGMHLAEAHRGPETTTYLFRR